MTEKDDVDAVPGRHVQAQVSTCGEPMTEADLKGELVKTLKATMRSALVFRHEDKFTAAIPDISVTWIGRTTWWEVKHCNPSLQHDALQEFTMVQLAGAGYARYIIYREQDEPLMKRVSIVHPRNIKTWNSSEETGFEGYDHTAIVEQIRRAHSR